MGIDNVPVIGHTGDWHLGHNRVPSSDTIHDIKEYLFPAIPEMDILIIAGDIFDTSVSMNSDDAPEVLALFVDLFNTCYKHNVILRIMQGTFTHDRNQLRILYRLHAKLGIPLNFRLKTNIEIEYIKDIDSRILFLPDNLPYKYKADVLRQVNKLMVGEGISEVDYVVTHGEFTHATCGYQNPNAYEITDFNTICKYWVLSSHIHKPSKKGKVIYSGSFNRLAHNEEESKGFWVIRDKPKFIKNKDATRFITKVYSSDDLEALLTHHDELIKQRFDPKRIGYLRLIIEDVHLRQAVRGFHDKHYPNIKLTFKHAKKTSEESKFLECKLKSTSTEILEVPSVKNIASIVCRYLSSTRDVRMKLSTVEEIINGIR